jgi:zinc and cadmium transporter
MDLLYSLLAAFAISLLAFSGWIYRLVPEHKLQQVLPFALAVAIGVLLGNAFFHLIPDAVVALGSLDITMSWVLIGLVTFFMIEKLFGGHEHQGLAGKIGIKPVGKMILIGDAVHNFIDGCLIAASFATSTELGLITTVAIAFHELPQEISDTGVLIHSGYTLKKAILLNFSVALTILGGVVFIFFLKEQVNFSMGYMLPITAGGFIYIATADMMPELHSRYCTRRTHVYHGLLIISGIVFMLLAGQFEEFLIR